MKTVRIKMQACALGLSAAICTTALPLRAEEVTVEASKSPPSKQANIGAVTGLALGAAAGGPFGAIAGLAAGAWLGDRYHKQLQEQAITLARLDQSEGERTRLVQNVTELNGSLSKEQERDEQLDLALSEASEVQAEVPFRTNDDSIQPQSMSPLLKLGALAAALPEAKVRVSGYADARGSELLNMELSRRRAQAVAAVLHLAGVEKDDIIIESFGKSQAIAPSGDLDGCALDRRVTVHIERAMPDAVALNE